jgi:hypothetical protein
MGRSNCKLGNYMLLAVRVLACGFIFNSALGLLYAQQVKDSSASPSPESSSGNSSSSGASHNDTSPVPTEPLTFSARLNIYAHSFISPQSYIGPALGAGIGQWEDSPHEWGEGAEGYGLRYGSGFGRSVISRTTALGVATADHEDDRFFPSNKTGIWRRTRHAIVTTFISRTDTGGTMPAYSRFTGVYSAAFIANAWEPPSEDNIHDAVLRGTTALLSNVGWHMFKEFWPSVHNAFHHNHD